MLLGSIATFLRKERSSFALDPCRFSAARFLRIPRAERNLRRGKERKKERGKGRKKRGWHAPAAAAAAAARELFSRRNDVATDYAEYSNLSIY